MNPETSCPYSALSKEELIAFVKTLIAQNEALTMQVQMLAAQNQALTARVAELERRLALKSSTSSKPPSFVRPARVFS